MFNKGTSIAFLAAAFGHPAAAGDLSANIGFNTDYIYRGIPQRESSAFGGVDYQNGGFYAGAWAADVGAGAEIDYYGGYRFLAGDFEFSVGGTWYTYTGDFDDEYLELNLGASWKWFSLDLATGTYANFDGPELAYRFYAVTFSHKGFHVKLGTFEDAFDGTYYETGYGNTLSVNGRDWVDYGVSLVHSDSTLLGGGSDSNIVLSLSRSFDF